MPSYLVTAPDGRRVKLTGDTPPTDADLDEVFSSLPSAKPDFDREKAYFNANPLQVSRPPVAPPIRTGALESSLGDQFKAVGNVVRALPADIASMVSGAKGGNLKAAFQGEPTLPIDLQLKLASQESPAAATLGKVGQGVAATAPMALAGGLPAWAGKLVAAGFSAKMIADAPELARQLGTELGKNPEDRDQDKLTSLVSDAIQTGVFAPLAGAATAHPTGNAVEIAKALKKAVLTTDVGEAKRTALKSKVSGLEQEVSKLQQQKAAADLQAAMRGNQLKPSEPSTAPSSSRPPMPGAEPVPTAPAASQEPLGRVLESKPVSEEGQTVKTPPEPVQSGLKATPTPLPILPKAEIQAKTDAELVKGYADYQAEAKQAMNQGRLQDASNLITQAQWHREEMQNRQNKPPTVTREAESKTIPSVSAEVSAGQSKEPASQTLPLKTNESQVTGVQQGSKVKVGKSPQPHTIVEVLPQSEVEKANGEQPIKVKNDRTGEESTVLQSDVKPIKQQPKKANVPRGTIQSKLKALGYSDLEIGAMSPEGQKALAERGQPREENIHTGKLGNVGMGGAKPSEFENSPKTPTGIKNATVDEERAKRGLPPAMQAARRSFGTVWDEAMSTIEKDPDAQTKLINELHGKARAVTDKEDALLLHRQIDLQNEYGKATRELAQANDDAENAPSPEAADNRRGDAQFWKQEVARISDELQKLYDINKRVGTETGRGLNARKMMAYEDYTLAAMETRLRSAKGGKRLTDAESAEVKKVADKVGKTQKAIEEREKQVEADSTKPRTFDLLKALKARLKNRIEQLEREIANKRRDAKKTSSLELDQEARDLQIKRDELKKAHDEIFPREYKPMTLEQRLEAYKTRLKNSTKDAELRTMMRDFESRPKSKLPMDVETLKLKAAYENAKLQFDRMVKKEQLKNRTTLEKTQDTFTKWRRAFLLSSPATLAKLTSAALWRLSFTPLEEGVGKVYSSLPILNRISDRAAREGGASVSAEAKALTEGFTKGMQDAWQTLRTGKSDLDTLYGRRDVMPHSMIDFIGSIHGALKAPVKRAEFARSLQKRFEFAIRNGMDVSDPMVQSRIAIEAYKDAQRSIFMQDNKVSAAWNAGIAILESPDKVAGKTPPGRKALATAGKTLLPIVKVPTNIVAETIQVATGLVTGSARLAFALRKGVENIKPEEADLIMRELNKGSLGAALILVGFFNPQAFGGYYQPNKKPKEGEAKFGSAKLFGVNIPTILVHNPLLEALQIGATVRRVADSKLRKHDKDEQGLPAGVVAAGLGLADEVPFVRETTELAKAMNPTERTKYIDQFARDLIVPLGVSWVAQHFDKDSQGHYIIRKTDDFKSTIEAAIPALREHVKPDWKKTNEAN